MRVDLEASRALLYDTALIVDVKDGLEHRIATLAAESGDDVAAEIKVLKRELKTTTRLAALFTPMCKAFSTEMANRVAYDAIQVHGGSGYMRDFAVERHARDARITNIYEGTTQLQIVAAIGGVLGGTLAGRLDELDGGDYASTPELLADLRVQRAQLEQTIERIRDVGEERFRDYHARRLVEAGTDVVCGYLLARDAQIDARKLLVARHFVEAARARVAAAAARVAESRPGDLDDLARLGRLELA
jgi:hypothetical protein